MSGDQEIIHGFTHGEVIAGSSFSYLRNYTDGTAFFVSTVLQDVFNGDCNSSLTLVPIPNNAGVYPIFTTNGVFINCTTGSAAPVTDRTQYWEYRVAGI